MMAATMLHRPFLLSLAPMAVAGGTLTTWTGAPAPEPVGVPGQLVHTVAPAPLRVVPGRDSLMHGEVFVNGQRVDMIVDTGASRTLLSERDARRVFGAAAGEPTGRIRTLNGEQNLYTLQAASVKLGGRLYRNLPAGRVDGGSLSVLGLDWLELAGPVTLAR